jgi:GNAT superfamily N-acetyltransferase
MQPAPGIRYELLRAASEATPYLGMTYRSFTPLLLALNDAGPGVAVAAVGDVPLGLALAELKGQGESAQVQSLYVVPAARRQGIATQLLARLEDALANVYGAGDALAVYPGGKDSTPAVERLLAKRGWSAPTPRMYLFQATRQSLETLLQAPWMRATQLPPEYEFFPWSERTPADEAVVLAGLQAGRFPPMLSPFNEAAIVEPAVSLGLRYRGEMYGWMIGHRIAAHTIRYTALFVREDIPHKGLGFRMFVESLHRHIALERDFPDATGCWGVLANNPFAGFLQRRLLPHLPDASLSLTHEAHKILLEPEATV